MSCFYPIRAYRGRGKTRLGKSKIVFKMSDGFKGSAFDLPCGQCIDCRLERSRQWAVRCVYESKLYDDNCFITLTFDEQHLPSDGSIDVRVFQLFMKRLRKRFGSDIRFFHCGEYGTKFSRPHYHACLFNFNFPDLVFDKTTGSGFNLYTSKSLSELWPFGFSWVGDFTFETAAYVARYILKKVTGKLADDYYQGRKPEYITMSRRPGIGKGWYDKFKNDVYPSDEVIIRGKSMKPPKFFDSLFELENPSVMERIKFDRVPKGEAARLDNDSFRRPVKEFVKKSRLKLLKRNLEDL